jgi:NAD(P)-dependent dehydrogenase (short-subunit alcohol dehydrogenase family)
MPGDQPVAVVTGANRGIGLEVCRQLAELDYRVVLGSRDVEKGHRAAASLERADRVTACQLDVADDASVLAAAAWVTAELGRCDVLVACHVGRWEDCDDLVDTVYREFGRCDVLVNNAAILYDTWARAESADLGVVHEALETNLFGAWRVTLALLPLLRQSTRGRIVNVSSQGGSLASMGAGTPAYHVSKAALNALTRTLAAELRPAGVLVNAVCPGWTATDMGGGGGWPVAAGAASVVWAATLADDGPSGGFFRDGKHVPW